MKKIAIISGGRVSPNFIKQSLKKFNPDVTVVADRGVMVCKELSLIPDYIVGDFDSGEHQVIMEYKAMFEKEGRPIIRSFNPEKDETDTELALSVALSLSPKEILLLGGSGTRLDHTMANVWLLSKAMKQGIRCFLQDEYNRVSMYDEDFVLQKDDSYPYFSLLAFGGKVEGLSILGAKYELDAYDLSFESTLCISNEFKKKEVNVRFKKGRLLLFQSSDVPNT